MIVAETTKENDKDSFFQSNSNISLSKVNSDIVPPTKKRDTTFLVKKIIDDLYDEEENRKSKQCQLYKKYKYSKVPKPKFLNSIYSPSKTDSNVLQNESTNKLNLQRKKSNLVLKEHKDKVKILEKEFGLNKREKLLPKINTLKTMRKYLIREFKTPDNTNDYIRNAKRQEIITNNFFKEFEEQKKRKCEQMLEKFEELKHKDLCEKYGINEDEKLDKRALSPFNPSTGCTSKFESKATISKQMSKTSILTDKMLTSVHSKSNFSCDVFSYQNTQRFSFSPLNSKGKNKSRKFRFMKKKKKELTVIDDGRPKYEYEYNRAIKSYNDYFKEKSIKQGKMLCSMLSNLPAKDAELNDEGTKLFTNKILYKNLDNIVYINKILKNRSTIKEGAEDLGMYDVKQVKEEFDKLQYQLVRKIKNFGEEKFLAFKFSPSTVRQFRGANGNYFGVYV